MKKLFLALLLCPLAIVAQRTQPRFENDTLYTSSGYTIFKGKLLQLGNGTSEAGYFRFIKFHQSMGRSDSYSLQNSTIQVTKVKGYRYSSPDNNQVRISGMVTYKDGKKAEAEVVMNFERATEDYDGLPSELLVPAELKIRRTVTEKAELKKQPAVEETKKQPVTGEAKKQPVPDELKKLLVADEIKKLFDLYKAGALTKEEYEAQKKKLLEQ